MHSGKPETRFFQSWKQRAGRLKTEVYVLYLAYKDPRVPWYARIVLACVLGYAFSPIDLIPDSIPILGYLDDLILVPLGVTLALKMIPSVVIAECREEAERGIRGEKPAKRIAAAIVIITWLVLAALIAVWIGRIIRP